MKTPTYGDDIIGHGEAFFAAVFLGCGSAAMFFFSGDMNPVIVNMLAAVLGYLWLSLIQGVAMADSLDRRAVLRNRAFDDAMMRLTLRGNLALRGAFGTPQIPPPTNWSEFFYSRQ